VAIASRATGKRIETWLSPLLARELKKLADRDRRSVSAVIRNVVEVKLRAEEERLRSWIGFGRGTRYGYRATVQPEVDGCRRP